MSFFPYVPSITLPSQVFSSPAVAILLPITLGSAVGYATRPKATKQVYAAIRQPPLRPPAWVFGPVWTVLYGTMGYAAYRATTIGLAHPDPSIRSLALVGTTAYTTQLGLNLVWMPLFFGLRKPALALADIVALTANVGTLAALWSQWDKTSAYLMVPYLAWLSFATYITAGVGVMNNWDISRVEKQN
ncbi:TspO/MBR-related protein [Morchella conica CCBAS932]|uniref:TspO/MBR-related protein n=1 Tax=Morchella conica CCBAS932 TaxID=1392247 RepID=A0A3N4L7M1_9PEZI|nr:TspO/MBR-related protein [Morchella conica CCBAS932]